jgi:hypothetical protein
VPSSPTRCRWATLSRVRYQDTPRLAAWLVRAKWPLPMLAAIAYAVGNVAVALTVFFAAYLASGALSSRSYARSESDI